MTSSKHEIETKWLSDKISRVTFNKAVWSLIEKVSHRGWEFKVAGGPDHYFTNSLGYVARHRDGKDLKELTVKARVDTDDITIRVEHNIPLDLKKADAKVVHAYLRTSGFSKSLTIIKDCDIYTFKMKSSPVHATVVWYKVQCKGHKNRQFIEVEVDGGSKKQRIQVLKMWQKLLSKKLKLSNKDVCQESLYEIYTHKKYLMENSESRKKN